MNEWFLENTHFPTRERERVRRVWLAAALSQPRRYWTRQTVASASQFRLSCPVLPCAWLMMVHLSYDSHGRKRLSYIIMIITLASIGCALNFSFARVYGCCLWRRLFDSFILLWTRKRSKTNCDVCKHGILRWFFSWLDLSVEKRKRKWGQSLSSRMCPHSAVELGMHDTTITIDCNSTHWEVLQGSLLSSSSSAR